MSTGIAEHLVVTASAGAGGAAPLSRLETVSAAEWRNLADNAAEPNPFFDPDYCQPAFAFAAKGGGAQVIAVRAEGRLLALLPVVRARRALRLPLPVLLARQPYAPLTAPLLSADDPIGAAEALLDRAAASGARVLSLPVMPLDGAAGQALAAAMAKRGVAPVHLEIHERAVLDAGVDAETYLRGGMGAKKLKELRRQRHRLDEEGVVHFASAQTREDVAAALERFLLLEASGWKGRDGTGLGQDEGDRAFVQAMAGNLSARDALEVLELTLDGRVIASGLVLRQGGSAFFFKIAYDETLSRYSPGVQLTVELTRRLSEDPAIAFADSTADAGHPMIDHVWRERIRVADMVIPLRAGDPVAATVIEILRLRRTLREGAKRLRNFFKSFKEKRL
ncbi:hypothetical protein GCM10011321_37910 [Youhaiella tibetensis]|uniref:GNAT family N-acetyltransferase n=1 Tax=Paradevosia tibetensis TaxID=1447062 RepID=A0A5B9DTM4_9HYPH|nr:GNAT family N-acetyltransferase [Youhaiella tibetensis]QEE22265.1 GNAT family N-acetyltransferase [Youhaiella tibetensis]GGF43775.1 hypothetical protein GCM10011321_37910 [Youhaiella tibetensis]